MQNKEKLLKNIILILNTILFYYLVFIGRNQYLYDMNYLKSILFMVFHFFFLFFYGVLANNRKTYNSNIILYIVLYSYLLFAITFIIGRSEFKFYNWWYIGQYKPFYTILSQFKYGSTLSIIKNIFGNSIMLLPLSFLLMIKNKKFNNILKQSIIILPIIIIIELLQALTHTGTFDIDDIILNYIGTLIFTFLITRFHIIDKIRKLFNTDFKLKMSTKRILFYIWFIILIFLDVVYLFFF